MGHHCGCGHNHGHEEEKEETPHECACGHDHGHDHSAGGHQISSEDAEKLKKAIIDAGYTFEETPNGDIKILQK